MAQPPRPTSIEIDTCAADAAGIVLAGSAADGTAIRAVIPAAEKQSCAKLVPGVVVKGTLETTCATSADATLTKVSVVSPRPVKQLTRAQLEAEVQQLRIANAKLRALVEAANRREREQIERLKRESAKLNTKLRD